MAPMHGLLFACKMLLLFVVAGIASINAIMAGGLIADHLKSGSAPRAIGGHFELTVLLATITLMLVALGVALTRHGTPKLSEQSLDQIARTAYRVVMIIFFVSSVAFFAALLAGMLLHARAQA